MRKDWLILAATAAVVANIYYDNALVKRLAEKKYYQMVGVAVVGFFVFLFFRKNPRDSRKLVEYASGTLQYLPIDRTASRLLTPVLKYVGREGMTPSLRGQGSLASGMGGGPGGQGSLSSGMGGGPGGLGGERKKRSVSETKKKFVAAQQQWRCKDCQSMLTAWFEVDHVRSLESGGTNDVSNLVALCRNCHGKKTAMSHM